MINKCVTVSFVLLIPLRYIRKITRIITEKLHIKIDMPERKVTKVTIITSKTHTNKKNYFASRICMKLHIIYMYILYLCNYCNYSVTDSDFVCNFSVIQCNFCNSRPWW